MVITVTITITHVYTPYVGELQSLIFIIMFSVACEISPFTSTHFEPMRAAVLDLTHSMCQLEIQDEVQF